MLYRAIRAATLASFLLLPALLAASPITGWEQAPDNPRSPGYHKLLFHYPGEDGKERTTPFLLYLPEEFARSKGPWPMLVFLHGLGERGHDAQMLYSHGVPRDLYNNPELQKWLPMVILIPQCPADVRWETPGTGKMVASMVSAVSAQWPIDPTRVYLTGLSMGGSGCWSVSRDGPSLFAVIVPIVGNEVEPDVVAAALKGKGATCLVISGTKDPKSEPGSSHMVEALRRADVDTVQVKVPFGGHNLWPPYYGNKVFYEWLLSHRLGQKPPADRLGADALLAMAADLAKGNEQRYKELNEQLQPVARWWEVDGCNLRRDPGLRPMLMGHSNVYVTHPLTEQFPCRLQTTITLPAKKHVMLRLKVGRHPKGSWKLGLRVNEHEHFQTVIDAARAVNCWATIDIDLSQFAGQEVRLQLVQSNNGAVRDDAYWESVSIVAE